MKVQLIPTTYSIENCKEIRFLQGIRIRHANGIGKFFFLLIVQKSPREPSLESLRWLKSQPASQLERAKHNPYTNTAN